MLKPMTTYDYRALASDALRKTTKTQCAGQLRTALYGVGYCANGIIAEALGLRMSRDGIYLLDPDTGKPVSGYGQIEAKLGLDTRAIVRMNDHSCKTFAQIADWIDAQP